MLTFFFSLSLSHPSVQLVDRLRDVIIARVSHGSSEWRDGGH